ncbi:hypothetical protein PCE1_003531 [Barthelona sp. PCE]
MTGNSDNSSINIPESIPESQSITITSPLDIQETPSTLGSPNTEDKVKKEGEGLKPRISEILAFAGLDVASSSYITVIVTVVYSSVFVDQIASTSSAANTLWSVFRVLAMIISLIVMPVVGAITDLRPSRSKKPFLVLASLLMAVCTMLLFFVDIGDIVQAIILLTLAQVGFNLFESVASSFLMSVARIDKHTPFVSGLGFALGYIGALVVLVFYTLYVGDAEGLDLVEKVQYSVIGIGIWVIVFTLPGITSLKVREPPKPGSESMTRKAMMKEGFVRLATSWKTLKNLPVLRSFLVSFFFYYAGLDVVIGFTAIIAVDEELIGMTNSQLAVLFIVLQVSAFVGALLFGLMEGKYGSKNMIVYLCCQWVLGIFFVILIPTVADWTGISRVSLMVGVSIFIGTGIGSLQSASRAIVGLLSPVNARTELMSLYLCFSKAGALASLALGIIADVINMRVALLVPVLLFAIGGMLIARINLKDEFTRIKELNVRIENGYDIEEPVDLDPSVFGMVPKEISPTKVTGTQERRNSYTVQ